MVFVEAMKLLESGKRIHLLDWGYSGKTFISLSEYNNSIVAVIHSDCPFSGVMGSELYSFSWVDIISNKWVEFE